MREVEFLFFLLLLFRHSPAGGRFIFHPFFSSPLLLYNPPLLSTLLSQLQEERKSKEKSSPKPFLYLPEQKSEVLHPFPVYETLCQEQVCFYIERFN